MKKKDLKIQSLTELGLVIGLLIVINFIFSSMSYRIDFTSEKRYTLSEASKSLAADIDDIMYVKVYLDGELSPAFQRLRNSTREMLDEFRYASGGNIEYEIYNPLEGTDAKEKRDVLKELAELGVQPIDLYEKTDGGTKQNIIVPGASFYYKNKTYPLNLLNPNFRMNNPETINQSIEGLEYAIANVIRRCVMAEPKHIGFLEGHGELMPIQVGDVMNDLTNYFTIERFNLHVSSDTAFLFQFAEEMQGMEKLPEDSLGIIFNEVVQYRLANFDCIVIAKPRFAFSNQEKYYIDQYIMGGGKVIWLIDPLIIEMDSLVNNPKVYTADYDLDLTDLLFKYGIRVNPDVVQDLNGMLIPFRSDLMGSAQVIPKPWHYFPVVASDNKHAITRNLDLVWFRFPASIDTVGSKSLKKTVLLSTSDKSHISNHPAEIDINSARKPLPEEYFNKANIPLAVLVEGPFESFFKLANRKDLDPGGSFITSVPHNKMIVISDGDLIRNDFKMTGEIFQAGQDRFSGKIFGNKEFFLNCVDYLCDDYGLIEVRTKEVKLRMIDKDKIDKSSERNRWKAINMGIPVAAILLFGVINHFIRRKKYG